MNLKNKLKLIEKISKLLSKNDPQSNIRVLNYLIGVEHSKQYLPYSTPEIYLGKKLDESGE